MREKRVSKRIVEHATIVVERNYKASPARIRCLGDPRR